MICVTNPDALIYRQLEAFKAVEGKKACFDPDHIVSFRTEADKALKHPLALGSSNLQHE